jgi:hypothetical protein
MSVGAALKRITGDRPIWQTALRQKRLRGCAKQQHSDRDCE